MVKVDPSPMLVSRATVPPWAETSAVTIESPSPELRVFDIGGWLARK
jgi:hypothetical protein